MDIESYLLEKRKIINQTLSKYLPKESEYPKIIHQAMRYSLFAGGKRLRPILTVIVAEMKKEKIEKVLPLACAIELIHTYSLVHDDLPSIDNDDYRRGNLSCHKAFNEAIAILTGNALLNLSFWVLTKIKEKDKLIPIIRKITEAVGSQGMIGGQVVDIQKSSEIKNQKKILKYIHIHKTAFLFKATMETSGILMNFSSEEIQVLSKYGENIGLAFQITDDILNINGKRNLLGKNTKTDKSRKKITYPLVYGIKYSKEKAKKLVIEAKKYLEIFKNPEILFSFADYIIKRNC